MEEDLLKSCLASLQFLSRMMDEMIYVCDLFHEKIYFADDYAEKLQIPYLKDTEYTLEQIQQFAYSRSGVKAFFKPDTFEEALDDIAYQEYYLIDGEGKNLKIYSQEKRQCDSDGNPRWIIGHVSEIVSDISEEEIMGFRRDRELLKELKESVENDFQGFFIRYYPKVNAETYQIYGVEAKLCYRSKTGEEVEAERLFPILERTGLIAKTDKWILKYALLQCVLWRKHLPDLQVTVKMSMVQLKETTIWDRVFKELKGLGLSGHGLTLEVDENVYRKDHQALNRIFAKMRNHGVRIAIDNFATAYTSMGYLNYVTVDEIRISSNLISEIQHSAYNYRLVGNLIELAHESNVLVVCKGVETETELRTLKELHPDLLQGYLFGKPFTEQEFEEHYVNAPSAAYQWMRKKEQRYQKLRGRTNSLEQDYARYEKMAAVLDGMDEIIYVSSQENDELLYLNAAGRKLTDSYDYEGKKCYEIMCGQKTPCEFCQKCYGEKDAYHVWEFDNEYLGRHFLTKNKVIQWAGKMAHLVVCIDITEKEIMSKAAASKDPLTGVYNRKAFEEKMGEHVHKSEKDLCGTLVMFDLDNFKKINDGYGHIAGDNVLKHMVEAMNTCFRKDDLVGRLGGDEFLVFLKDLTDKECVARRLYDFQEAFAKVNRYQSTCSMGVTIVKKENYSYHKCVAEADSGLYKSKENGKDKFSYYEG